MLCNNDRVCWVIFHFIKLLHSKHLSSFLQNFSMRCFRCSKKNTVQNPITRSLNNNFTLESTPSRIFLLSFDFDFVFTTAQQRAWARFGVFSKRNCYF